MKLNVNLKKMTLSIVAITTIALGVFTASGSSNPNAGTPEDPLVTLSYVEMRLESFNNHVSNQIKDIDVPEAPVFTVVEVEAGKKITFGASVEFIVRGGECTAVVSDQGGLADLTSGVDIMANQGVPANHHILVPRNDGRGFTTTTKTWVMVKGEYTIQ